MTRPEHPVASPGKKGRVPGNFGMSTLLSDHRDAEIHRLSIPRSHSSSVSAVEVTAVFCRTSALSQVEPSTRVHRGRSPSPSGYFSVKFKFPATDCNCNCICILTTHWVRHLEMQDATHPLMYYYTPLHCVCRAEGSAELAAKYCRRRPPSWRAIVVVVSC